MLIIDYYALICNAATVSSRALDHSFLASFLTHFELHSLTHSAVAGTEGAPQQEVSSIRIVPRPKVAPVLNADGCVAVAESVHCPPRHNIDLDLAEKYNLPVGIGHGG